jgi:CheY-like chemotaxis protein
MSSPVLLIEDDLDSPSMIAMWLQLAGHRVITAANGRDGYQLACDHHPCVISFDLMMPVMTGQEFRAAQLANPAVRDIPVVVVSARHDAPAVASRIKAAAASGSRSILTR